jgi:hypothetical protein
VHVLPEQTIIALAGRFGTEHETPHWVPQEFDVDAVWQLVPHWSKPPQPQLPPEQVRLPWHANPQVPQLLLSLDVFVHPPGHAVSPFGQEQEPPPHVSPDTGQAAQALPPVPHPGVLVFV